MNEYVTGNLEFLTASLRSQLPECRVIQPEGTYLAWLDFRFLSLPAGELEALFTQQCGVLFDHGSQFGTGGEGFERINVACPRAYLKECVTRITAVIERGGNRL